MKQYELVAKINSILSNDYETDLIVAFAKHSMQRSLTTPVAQRFTNVDWFQFRLDHSVDVSIDVIDLATTLAKKRSECYPLQYLLGTQQFRDHYFDVGPGVLVPRPETEWLVDLVLDRIAMLGASLDDNSPDDSRRSMNGFELGVGSGCISLSLLKEATEKVGHIFATDVSNEAMNYSGRNRELLGLSPDAFTFLHVKSDVKNPMSPFLDRALTHGKADFFVSNPPYLDPKDEIELGVRIFEPREALYSVNDPDPLFFFRQISKNISKAIRPGGFFVLEMSHDRSAETYAVFAGAPGICELEVVNDATERPRFLVGEICDTD